MSLPREGQECREKPLMREKPTFFGAAFQRVSLPEANSKRPLKMDGLEDDFFFGKAYLQVGLLLVLQGGVLATFKLVFKFQIPKH